MVLDLVNLVTNLAKPSLGQPGQQPDQTVLFCNEEFKLG